MVRDPNSKRSTPSNIANNAMDDGLILLAFFVVWKTRVMNPASIFKNYGKPLPQVLRLGASVKWSAKQPDGQRSLLDSRGTNEYRRNEPNQCRVRFGRTLSSKNPKWLGIRVVRCRCSGTYQKRVDAFPNLLSKGPYFASSIAASPLSVQCLRRFAVYQKPYHYSYRVV